MKKEVLLLSISVIFSTAYATECEYYKVQKGDTIWDIAEKKGLTVEDIISANRGLDKGKLITGKRICIPQKTIAKSKGHFVKHKVKKGESLSSIAEKYGISVDEIAKANNLRSKKVLAGQELLIPAKGQAVAKRREKDYTYYTIQRGGRLSDAAKKLGVPLKELEELNSEYRNRWLSKGTKIKIPKKQEETIEKGHSPSKGSYTYYTMQRGGRLKDVAKKLGVPLDDLESLNPEYKNKFLAKGVKVKVPKEAKEFVKHRVRKGETLSSIAKKYHVSVDEIVKANDLKSRKALVGKTLLIPVKGKHEISVSKREEKPLRIVEESNGEKNVANHGEVNIGKHSIQMPVDGKIVKATRGVDIVTKCESAVKSVEDGKVIYSGGDLQAYGNMVIIEHDNFISLYAYNSKNLVKRGDSVSKGQDIAMVGSKSGSDECMLHFEIRAKDGAPLDPTEYLKNTQ